MQLLKQSELKTSPLSNTRGYLFQKMMFRSFKNRLWG
jgi:hypothetical protein